MTDWIETLTDLAVRAGRITLKYFQAELEVFTKENLTPVTIADHKTEEFLREEIARRFPGDCIVGEEFGEGDVKGALRRWIIDPIDGTKTFLHGVPLYGVMIGIEEDGEIVAGAVHLPALNEIIVAQKGRGCWWNGRSCRVSVTKSISDALLLTTDLANNYRSGRGDAWDRLASEARLVRTWGDCYGHMLVATGRADIMVDPELEQWDAAALKIIIEEAGGSFTDYEGNATIYGGCGISTNGVLLKDVLGIVKAAGG